MSLKEAEKLALNCLKKNMEEDVREIGGYSE
jgi:20S proteasome alpha/beta subunit